MQLGVGLQTPNQALQQTAGHESFLGLQAHRCPAAAELGRSSSNSGDTPPLAEEAASIDL